MLAPIYAILAAKIGRRSVFRTSMQHVSQADAACLVGLCRTLLSSAWYAM